MCSTVLGKLTTFIWYVSVRVFAPNALTEKALGYPQIRSWIFFVSCRKSHHSTNVDLDELMIRIYFPI